MNTYERELLRHLTTVPGAKELMSSLKKDTHLIAVTTGSERSETIKKLKSVSLYSYVDYIVTSNEIGFMKPHPDYYLSCLKLFSGKKSDVLVVGDDDQEDLEPARQLGLQTFLIPPNLKHLSLITETFSSWFTH